MRLSAILTLAVLPLACAPDGRGNSPFGGGVGSGAEGTGATTEGGPSDSGASGGSTDGGDDGDGARFDTPDGATAGGDEGSEDECESVDLLFVIDNSASMENDVINLINSFPGFVSGIQESISATSSYHIGVASTDDTYAHPSADPSCESLGVLIDASSAGACGPYASGKRFFTDDDDIAARFQCAATHGSQGNNNERALESAMLAVSEDYSAAGGCNEGFIRDEALLVVVLITDEDEGQAPGEPADWYGYFLDRKKGLEDNLVVLSILMGPGAPAECNVNWNGPGNRLIAFTELFQNGHVGDICQPDFSPFFQDAVAHISAAFADCRPVPEG